MAPSTSAPVVYRPALLPGGTEGGAPSVPLARATAFSALIQDVMQERFDTSLARVIEEIDAERVADVDAPPPPPQTYDEMVGNVPVGTAARARTAMPKPTGFEVFEAVVHGDPKWRARFASVCVWAVSPGAPETHDTIAGYRRVTEEEAGRVSFPAGPFAEALPDFFSASAPLMAGLYGGRADTGSSSTATEA